VLRGLEELKRMFGLPILVSVSRKSFLRRLTGHGDPAGLGAAKLGDTATANLALEKLKAMRVQAESGSNAYRAKPFAIMEKEVGAALASAQKDTAAAERLLKDATAIELSLDAPSGPAEPIQPSFELYGDLLIELHRPAEAAAQFQQALQRMPNRRASLRGLERASGQRPTTAGQPAGASQ